MEDPVALTVAEGGGAAQVEQRSAAAASIPSKRSSKRMLNKEISIIMLIMAAQTISGMMKIQESVSSTELIAESYNFHDRPWLHDKPFSSTAFYSSASSLDQLPYVSPSEGITSSRSSGASESCDDDRDEEEVAAARLASRLTTPRRVNQRFAQDEDVWENIFSLLPWEAATQARALSKYHFGDALAHVTIARMPQSKVAAVFIPCLEDLDGDEMAVEAELAPQLASADAPLSGGQRLFLGQLRRTGTVPMVRWLVNKVFNAPPGALVSVENRRNTRTQRGKGCAWATINDAATVERMLGAHHRLFFDTVEGVEGVWLVPEGHEDALQTEVSLRNDGSAHAKHMPRGTIVVEIPSTTAPAAPADAFFGGAYGATPAYGCSAPDWSVGAPYPSYPTCEAMLPLPTWMGAMADSCASFTPYRVPGADFVQPGMYRHNPYTTMA